MAVFHSIRRLAAGQLLIAVLVLMPACAAAGDDLNDIATLAVMAGIDFVQSKNNFKKGHRELNPVLGRQPSDGDMLAFGIGGIAATYGIMKVLPDGRFRRLVIDSVLATERFNLIENRRVDRHGHRMFRETIMIILNFRF